MKKIFILSFILLPFIALAQPDKAKDVLNKLSKKVDSYKSLYIEYGILTEDEQEHTKNRQDGKVTAEKKKFKLVTKDNEVYCDGITKWTYMKNVQEVNIQKNDLEADDIFSNPVKFLTGQSKAFKYLYKGLVDEDGKTYTEIDYYPKNIKAPYSIIRLHLDEKTLVPYSVKYFGRDGMRYTVRLKVYMPNVDVSDVDFTFDTTKFPAVEVIDLRDLQ